METEFGTKTAFTSDEKGMVTVLFPRDFKPAEKTPGRAATAMARAGQNSCWRQSMTKAASII